jgi:thioredoxin-like negative regulator of GroEL
MKSGKSFSTLIIVLLLALTLPNIISLLRGPAEKPGVFSNAYTLTEASELSVQSGKPLLVLATADWCAPCQSLKRGALSDPTVVDLINTRAIPVYLEDGVNKEEIMAFEVRSYPTTMVVQNGRVTGAVSGNHSAKQYAQLLEQVLPAPSE